MEDFNKLITENLDIWTQAIEKKSATGRGSNKKYTLYGIKKLRELILDLAVRGKLVPQDPKDEPASELLKRIETEKEQLVKDGKIKKSEKLTNISEAEKHFSKPSGWSWTKLGNLVEMYNGRSFKSSEWATSGIPIVRIQNLNDSTADYNYFEGELADHNKIHNNSFLISWSGTPGTSFGAFIWNKGDAALNQHINNCVFHNKHMNLNYMKLAVNSCMNHLISKAQGAVGLKHVTKGTLNNTVFCMPPEEEQERIIAKVNELMALCDQLEQQTEESITAHKTLVEVLLDTLTNSKDHDELSQNWNRISDSFDLLFTTEESIDLLKQAILQLAVMGKLVPQDPNDEPASELLKRIAAEKERLVKEGKIKRPKKLPEITEEEKPFEIPEEWEWCRLQDIGHNWGQKTPDDSFTYIDVSSINKNLGVIERPQILEKENAPSRARKLVDQGTIIYSTVRPYLLNIAIIDKVFDPQPIASTAFAIIHPYKGVNSNYIFNYLRSNIFVQYVESCQSGIAYPAINDKQFFSGLIPIAPTVEQIRIITKVKELMVLCNRLSVKIKLKQNKQNLLVDSIAGKV